MDEENLPSLHIRRPKKNSLLEQGDVLPSLTIQRKRKPSHKKQSITTNAPEYQEQERYQQTRTQQTTAPSGYSLLGNDIQTNKPVMVTQEARRQGLYITGIQGTGKSVLIENLIIQDIKQNMGVCLLDPHGDLTHAVLSRLPERRVKDVISLDITDYRYPFGINPFTCSDRTNPLEVQKIVDQVRHIFEKLLGVSMETQLILEYLYNCTYTLIANPGYTMADIPLLLQDGVCRRKLVANVTDIDVQLFWRLHDLKKPTDQANDVASTLRRVKQLLQPISRPIVGQSTSTIDMRKVMDEGKILLVKLDTTLESVTSLIGSLIIALILNAAKSRADLPVNKRRQFNLYADEFQRFATEDFATLLEEARKFGIGITIAHQNGSQLEISLKERARSVANLVVFKVNSKDADELAGEFDITPQEAWEEELEEEWVEVLEEEWTEKVEDEVIDGEESVQVHKRDVINHLLKQGHEDERVMQFVQTYLQPLALAIEKYTSTWFGSSDGSSIHKFTGQQAFVDINIWLYEGMVSPDKLIQPLPESFHWLLQLLTSSKIEDHGNPFYDFWYHFQVVDRFEGGKKIEIVRPATEKMQEEHARLTKQLRGTVLTLLPKHLEDFHAIRSRLFSQPQFTQLYHDAVEKRSLYEAKQAVSRELDEWDRKQSGSGWRWTGKMNDGAYVVEPNLPLGEYERKLAKYQQSSKEAIEKGYSSFEKFTEAAQLCQFALSQNPLMTTDSGLYQPRKRKQVHYITHPRRTLTHPRIAIMHPQRSYADMLNEVASQLTNLPVFTARVKIATDKGNEEHTIKTLDPKKEHDKPLFGQALQERKDRIKEQNVQDDYVRERTAVEAEIRQRQEQCSKPTEDEPPISRRPR